MAYTIYNDRIDDLLGQIGSTMTNQNNFCDTQCGNPPITIENTNGCATMDLVSFQTQAMGNINAGNGTVLMSACGAPVFVEEAVNNGLIYYISDINWLEPPACPGPNEDILMFNIVCNCANLSMKSIENKISRKENLTYPNPVNETLSIASDRLDIPYFLISNAGSTIKKGRTFPLYLGGIEAGLYYIRYTLDKEIHVERVVVKK